MIGELLYNPFTAPPCLGFTALNKFKLRSPASYYKKTTCPLYYILNFLTQKRFLRCLTQPSTNTLTQVAGSARAWDRRAQKI